MNRKQKGLTRREAMQLGVSAGVVTTIGAAPRRAAAAGAARGDGAATSVKNIIFMVSDGMSAGVPSLAEALSQRVRGRGTHWYELASNPATACGFMEMHSLNSLVTDSSAASSSWGSGSRIFNGAVNMLPDGTKLKTIGELARQSGRRVGLVTTTTITHATPAGFASVEQSRGNQHLIAPQYLDLVDVLMGGGIEFFDPARRGDGRDLIADYRAKGYAHWNHRRHVLGDERPDRVLGLFHHGHVPYTVDHLNSPELKERVPTLAEMSRVALGILAASGKGFLLQIEGGRVDHAAHENDAAGLLWDQLAFDDAIGVVREFVKNHPDTLVVITTDHGNANPGLRGMGSGYRDTNDCFDRVALMRATYGPIESRLREAGDGDEPAPTDKALDIIRETCGFEISEGHARTAAEAAVGRLPRLLNRQFRSFTGLMGQILCNYHGIGWVGNSHTEDFALTLGLGPGRDRYNGMLLNTDVFDHLTGLMGVPHRNPSMTRSRARQYLGRAPAPTDTHWT